MASKRGKRQGRVTVIVARDQINSRNTELYICKINNGP
jgi:hypothetical protein